MRNYIQIWEQTWDVYNGGVLSGELFHFSEDEATAAEYASTLPPFDGTDGFDPTEAPTPLWFLMDKTQVLNLCNGANRRPIGSLIEEQTPRYGIDGDPGTWPNNDGLTLQQQQAKAAGGAGKQRKQNAFAQLLAQIVATINFITDVIRASSAQPAKNKQLAALLPTLGALYRRVISGKENVADGAKDLTNILQNIDKILNER